MLRPLLPSLTVFCSVIGATFAFLVGPLLRYRMLTLDLVCLKSVHCFFMYLLKELREPFKPRPSEELGFLLPFVALSFNFYAYACKARQR